MGRGSGHGLVHDVQDLGGATIATESIGMAAEIYEGTCTDVPPPRKR